MSDTRILLGMSRPLNPPDTRHTDAEGIVTYSAVLVCTCGAHLWDFEAVREHWQRGHFDVPVYATKEEMMDRALNKGV